MLVLVTSWTRSLKELTPELQRNGTVLRQIICTCRLTSLCSGCQNVWSADTRCASRNASQGRGGCCPVAWLESLCHDTVACSPCHPPAYLPHAGSSLSLRKDHLLAQLLKGDHDGVVRLMFPHPLSGPRQMLFAHLTSAIFVKPFGKASPWISVCRPAWSRLAGKAWGHGW